MGGSQPRINLISLLRGAGLRVFLRKAMEQTWWTKLFFGLRCDLDSLPPIRRSKIEIAMKPWDSTTFRSFAEELKQVKGPDYVEVFLRQALWEAGVQTLHVAVGPDGSPAYLQWLITPDKQHLVHAHQPGRYPTLQSDEVLLEGAYTFCCYRRTGAMGDGMAQLLRIARAQGARKAFTYVAADNIPSLRGCANVGFVLDHVRMNTRHLGLRSSIVLPADNQARHVWSVAVSSRRAA